MIQTIKQGYCAQTLILLLATSFVITRLIYILAIAAPSVSGMLEIDCPNWLERPLRIKQLQIRVEEEVE